ncbi:hypothetical protein ACIBSW_01970 [Actinoplanes sp. NPDC049668]|uniref:hypothetical protein n=1 Tax=unclassified Actinoplanes TaxID=2626549 RepID=UPI0033A8A132
MIKRLSVAAGALSLVAMALAGWLWVDRGVGVGLRGHAEEILARHGSGRPPPSGPFLIGTNVESASTVEGGTRLTVEFVGEAPGNGPCERDYYAEAFESESAVVVVLEGKPRSLLERLNLGFGEESCLLIGHRRTATVVLTRPLGDRPVLDGHSADPVAVVVSG